MLNGKPTVLVVDDEPLVRATIADMLRAGGFEVLEAAAGSEALDLLASRQPDALVTDMRMPGMDGVELSQRVRVIHPQMPIVLVSGDLHLDRADLPARVERLHKPLRQRELMTTVARAINARSIETAPGTALQ